MPQQSTGKAAIWMAGWLLATLALTVAGRELGRDIPVFVTMMFRSLIALARDPTTDPAAAGFLLRAGFLCDDIFRGCALSHATENILILCVHYLT